MARKIKYLDDMLFWSGIFRFDGQLGLDYLLSFKELEVARSISAAFANGNHTIAGSSSSNGSSATLTFGHGATDVWLSGAGSWKDTQISGGDGDHAILIENVDQTGAQISLGSGNSFVQLGTAIGDTRTTITGGDGDFSIKAMDLRSVALGDGNHLVNVAKAASVTVGDGNSYVAFKTGYGTSATTITAGEGNHTVIGKSMAATAQTTAINFGDGVDGAGTTLQLDGANGTVNITGGSGDHVLQIEEMAKGKISLGHLQMADLGHDVTVNIAEVTSQSGVQLALGGGDHRVHIGTHARDFMTSVSAGDGNSEVAIGVAKLVDLGNGDHIIDAGDVSTITVGHGDSQVGFEASSVNFGNRITAGDGSHVIKGTSTTTGTTTTTVQVGDGNIFGNGSYIHLAGWHSGATVTAGDGDHTVTIDATKMGRVTLGDGDHVVDVSVEGTSSSAFINIGDGNSNLSVSGTGNVTMGAGNHVISAHDVTSIRTGAGEQKVFFEDGLNFSGTAIYTMGGGNDVIVGLGLDERPKANVMTYDGDDTIVLLDGNWAGSNVHGGAGFDTLYVDERAKGSLFTSGIEKIVYVSQDMSIAEALKLAGVSHPKYDTAAEPILPQDDLSFFTEATVRFDDLSGGTHQRVFDFGDGPMGNNIFLAQNAGTSDMRFVMLVGQTWYLTEAQNAIVEGETATWTAQITDTGRMQLFKNGELLSEAQAVPAPDVPRPGLLVGESHWAENTPLIGEVIAITADTNGDGIAELVEFTTDEAQLSNGPLAELDRVEPAPEIAVQPIEWFDLERKDFKLVALPDPESPAGVELASLDMTGGKKKPDAGEEFDPASREDRLMEPTSDFFQRAEAYTKSFATDAFNTFYNTVRLNEFGDLSGTNRSDVIDDARGDSQIFAMGGDDVINGLDGNDRIYAGDGDDIVRGGAGQDLLDGGDGYDILIGGDDIDIFVFRKGEGTTDILDFQLSFDILDVEGFDNLTYEILTNAGRQVGDDVFYDLGADTLILRNVELETMVEIDLCMR